jgi:hypothetical protein
MGWVVCLRRERFRVWELRYPFNLADDMLLQHLRSLVTTSIVSSCIARKDLN